VIWAADWLARRCSLGPDFPEPSRAEGAYPEGSEAYAATLQETAGLPNGSDEKYGGFSAKAHVMSVSCTSMARGASR